MEAILGAAGLIFVGAITPGPNNLIVLQAASRGGVGRAFKPIVAIVCGLLVLLCLTLLGVGALLQARPQLGLWVTAAGCVFLCGLGLHLITNTRRPAARVRQSKPLAFTSSWAIFVFQFLNPKAWILALTATSATQSTYGMTLTLMILAPLFVVIPAFCLWLWSSLGFALTRTLQHGRMRRWFDLVMGLLLIGFAVLLLLQQLERL